ncbi:hypothetical protein FGO68_gene2996 [Halteria grandinella]|uniref:Uncharacterized protein n=1 Tax=Halteria grandinella TaxID=5974 RepID=A0A8J8NZJ7_HALGN|nr:hypothetical protein FGO68_gene2996 [Halteria grandinella]
MFLIVRYGSAEYILLKAETWEPVKVKVARGLSSAQPCMGGSQGPIMKDSYALSSNRFENLKTFLTLHSSSSSSQKSASSSDFTSSQLSLISSIYSNF